MSECNIGTYIARTECVLTYDNSGLDIAINYILLALNFAWCCIALRYQGVQRIVKYRLAAASFIAVVIFQIVLCASFVGCTGISIIWCACGGWIIAERRHLVERAILADETNLTAKSIIEQHEWVLSGERLVVLADVTVIIYYAATSEPITTVAHVCALILGATMSMVCIQIGEYITQMAHQDYESIE